MFPIPDGSPKYFSSIDNTTYKERLSVLYSRDHTAYATLNLIGKHQVVAHGSEEYVR